MDEFDFDQLLDEIETEPTKIEELDEKNAKTNDNIVNNDVSDIMDNLDDSIVSVNDSSRNNDKITYDKIISDLENEIIKLKGIIKVAKNSESSKKIEKIDYSNLEFADETKSYIKAWTELEFEKQELQQQFKDLKEDFEEQGVHTKEALKAWRDYQKQFKETAEEVQEQEKMKAMFDDDETLKTQAATLAG